MAMLVDAFGGVPYSEALKAGADTPNLAPAYDDDVAIYADLISRAQAAISVYLDQERLYFR